MDFCHHLCQHVFSHLGVELCQKVKVLLEVRGQDGLNDEKAKALELHMIQVDQEVKFWPGQVEVPGGCSVVVLQHRPVVVEHGLHGDREWRPKGR